MTRSEYERRLLVAQQWLEAHLDEQIDPSEVAKVAHFSLHHFHRIFRAQLGESVMQHVRRLRLERAARSIRSTESRLLDIALAAGYDSHEAFTRAFAAHFGMTPSAFRKKPPPRLSAWNQTRPIGPAVPVRLEAFPAIRVAFMRQRGSYMQIGKLWQRMLVWTQDQKLQGSQPMLYGLCPDDPEVTDEALLRFDACVAVADSFSADNAVGIRAIPGGTFAVATHCGPYDRLHETYLDLIGRWFPLSGYEPAIDAVVEHYLNDPSTTRPDALLTEVRVRIAD